MDDEVVELCRHFLYCWNTILKKQPLHFISRLLRYFYILMGKKIRRYKWLLVGIFLFLGCLFIANILIDKILPGKLKSLLTSIDPRIQIDFASVNASVLRSTLHLADVTVQLLPDTTHTTPKHAFHFDKIDLDGIGFFTLLFHKKMVIRKIEVKNGIIKLNKDLLARKELNGFDFLSGLHLPFEAISIGRLNISKSSMEIGGVKVSELVLFAEASVAGISIDRDLKDSSAGKSSFSSFHCELSDIKYTIPGNAQIVKIKSISFGSDQDDWVADSLRIIPRFAKYEFAKMIGYQTDRIEAFISSIHITKPDWRQLLAKKLSADKITIGQTRLIVFRDRRIAMKTEKKPLPAAYFKDIPFEMDIHELHLRPSFVLYEEFPKEGIQSGTLKIEKLEMKIKPFISHASSSHDHIDMSVDGSVMGSGTVHADVYVPLKEDKSYEVAGSFSNLSLTSLNESAENLGGFHIESGLLNHLSFTFSMTDEKSTGQIVGEYHDLVIDKLKKRSGPEKEEDKFKTFVLQHLIIPRNKDKSMAVAKRTGKVNFKRDQNRYFSHYMLHSLLSGVKASFNLGFLLPG
jgi:hypothetical protein